MEHTDWTRDGNRFLLALKPAFRSVRSPCKMFALMTCADNVLPRRDPLQIRPGYAPYVRSATRTTCRNTKVLVYKYLYV